jgi:hypothetical protein
MMIKRHLVMVAVLLSMLMAAAVSAPSAAPPAATVPHQLQEIQQDITDLQNSVNNISAPDQSNVRFTPPVVVVPPDGVTCLVVNVTNVNQTVQVDLLRGPGSVIQSGIFPQTAPGNFDAIEEIPVSFGAVYRCRFTVVNGTRTAIRAVITIRRTLGNESDKVALPAD